MPKINLVKAARLVGASLSSEDRDLWLKYFADSEGLIDRDEFVKWWTIRRFQEQLEDGLEIAYLEKWKQEQPK